jgi:hypothetical protein
LIPTEPIGSVPRPLALIEAFEQRGSCDDTSTSRDTAFAKIRARVAGTALASEALGVR